MTIEAIAKFKNNQYKYHTLKISLNDNTQIEINIDHLNISKIEELPRVSFSSNQTIENPTHLQQLYGGLIKAKNDYEKIQFQKDHLQNSLPQLNFEGDWKTDKYFKITNIQLKNGIWEGTIFFEDCLQSKEVFFDFDGKAINHNYGDLQAKRRGAEDEVW